jgi:hypothetical protein
MSTSVLGIDIAKQRFEAALLIKKNTGLLGLLCIN